MQGMSFRQGFVESSTVSWQCQRQVVSTLLSGPLQLQDGNPFVPILQEGRLKKCLMRFNPLLSLIAHDSTMLAKA